MTEKFLYKYKVTYYDELEEKMIEEAGVLFAEGPLDVTEQLLHYYGENEVDALSLKCIDVTDVLPLYKRNGGTSEYKETREYELLITEFTNKEEKD